MVTQKQTGNCQLSVENQFIEIVNWKKAQPRMKGGGNDWLKLYTSLLEHDGFGGLDDAARMLIMGLWLYAARSGLHILPVDPKWIWRKIPMLNSEPDLGPLLEARDIYGNPTPFVRYCKAPVARKAGGKKKQGEKSRVEEKREEKREETKPLRVSRKERRERKERVGTASQKEESEEQKAEEPEKPENPKDSEDGSAKAQHFVPRPARSANRGPQMLGDIIAGRFKDHWLDPDAEAFGWEIVKALGMPVDMNNISIRSEWGSFASFWCNVKKKASPILLDEIRKIAFNKAIFVCSNKARSARNRSAVWFHIMYGELNSRGIVIPKEKSG